MKPGFRSINPQNSIPLVTPWERFTRDDRLRPVTIAHGGYGVLKETSEGQTLHGPFCLIENAHTKAGLVQGITVRWSDYIATPVDDEKFVREMYTRLEPFVLKVRGYRQPIRPKFNQ